MKKDLLRLADLSSQEIIEVLDLADKLKKEQKAGIEHHLLKGKTLGMIFAKASTRTRVSFEVGIYQLGGIALYLNANDIQIGRGEPIRDTARVLSRYLDGIMIRTYKQRDVDDLAHFSSVPVINGLTDYCHPCQVLADLQTIREYKHTLKGLKLAFIGDGNNMANSLIVGCVRTGMKMSIACPAGFAPDAELVRWGKESGLLEITEDPKKAVVGADVVYTDVWASMGQESETAMRKEVFKNYYIDEKLLKFAKKDVMVQHCLPAHRDEEITGEVFEKHSKEIFDEAENRLHAQKAIMVMLMDSNRS
jgi:ornithine carbamoyltransferase